MQLKRAHRQRWVFGAQTARRGQCFGGVIRHGGEDVGAGQQCAQPVELRHGQYHVAFAIEFFQLFINKPAQVACEGHEGVRAGAEVVQAQGAGHAVGAQQFRQAAAQHFALGVGRQVGGVAHADGNFPGGEQAWHQDVVDAAHHQHDAWRLGAQAFEQLRQQGEFNVVGQADTEHGGAGGGVELGSAAHCGGDRVQGRGEQGEDFHGTCRRLHAAPGTYKQRVIEQPTQTRQRRADGRLAKEQFLGGAGHTALMHQGFEYDQEVKVDTTQVVTVHLVSWKSQLT